MERQKTVVDASIGFKLFFKEAGSREAIGLLDRHKNGELSLNVPDLFFYEVLNALRYKGFNDEELSEVVEDLMDFQLQSHEPRANLLSCAARLSNQYGFTLYDASYAALAELLNAKIISADEELLRHPLAQ